MTVISDEDIERAAQKAFPYVDGSIGRVDRYCQKQFYRTYSKHIYPKVSFVPGTGFFKRLLREKALEIHSEDLGSVDKLNDFSWKVLAVLDGCRLDSFKEVIDEKSGSRTALGSSSQEFIQGNFSEDNWDDTVVITANPHYSEKVFQDLTGKKPSKVFHTVFPVYKSDFNSQKSTVEPEKVVEKFETAYNLFPEKRFILHFMQPHYPFIGEYSLKGRGISHKLNDFSGLTAWQKAEQGIINHEEVIKAYHSNLEYVWNSVTEAKNLVDEEQDFVVTADHGNLMGEVGVYGHPKNVDMSGLRKVPLYRFSGGAGV